MAHRQTARQGLRLWRQILILTQNLLIIHAFLTKCQTGLFDTSSQPKLTKIGFSHFLTPSYFTRINMPQTLDEQTQYILRMKSGAQKWLFSPKKARKMDKNLIFWTKIDLTKLKLILINWNTNLRITSNFWNHNRLSLVSSGLKTSGFWGRKPPLN